MKSVFVKFLPKCSALWYEDRQRDHGRMTKCWDAEHDKHCFLYICEKVEKKKHKVIAFIMQANFILFFFWCFGNSYKHLANNVRLFKKNVMFKIAPFVLNKLT